MNKIKVFKMNENGKIELTAKELEDYLNDSYREGYREGRNSINPLTTDPFVYRHPINGAIINTPVLKSDDKTLSTEPQNKKITISDPPIKTYTTNSSNDIKSYTDHVDGIFKDLLEALN